MYDEPFTGLDPITKGTIVTLINELNKTLGLTSVIVSHDVHETMSIADYIYVISEGQVVESGTPENLGQLVHHRGYSSFYKDCQMGQRHFTIRQKTYVKTY